MDDSPPSMKSGPQLWIFDHETAYSSLCTILTNLYSIHEYHLYMVRSPPLGFAAALGRMHPLLPPCKAILASRHFWPRPPKTSIVLKSFLNPCHLCLKKLIHPSTWGGCYTESLQPRTLYASIRSTLGVFTPRFLIREILRFGPSVYVKEKVQKRF